jgi:2-keto-4-pentenoate hydratase/2-oxohepta-3-ene-1,7-dioic acid hydratase in catechol pathway
MKEFSMRLATFSVTGKHSYGAVIGSGVVDLGARIGNKYPTLIELIRARALHEAKSVAENTVPDHRLDQVQLLPPVPGAEKILCVGINYPERSAEYKDAREKPKYPNLFVRFPGSLVGHEEPILRPKVSEQFDYEGEIVLVIGKEGRNVPRERALEHVFGMTLGNEGSVRDWLRHGTMNVTQGKNFDRSGSLGPWVTTADEVDPGTPLHLMTRVNGALRQDDTTDRLTWDFAELIRYVTMFTTLKPGDLVFTGTPTGAGGHQKPPQWLVPGDVVEVEVPELGILRNTVQDES